jgi:3-oxoadipate enol-lactonase
MPSLRRDAIELHYEVHGPAGDPLPLVMGHSFLCRAEMWGPLVPRLAERRRVVDVDLRGHGRSGPARSPLALEDLAADVLRLLDHLDIERAVIVGLSIGGMTGMRLAARHPDRIAAQVLISTSARGETVVKRLRYAALAAAARAVGVGPLAPRISPIMFAPATLRERPELVREWEGYWKQSHVPSILAVLEALNARADITAEISRVRCPTLVVHGARDAAIPLERAQSLARAIPGSELLVLPEAGHLLSLEAPDALFEAIERFLSRLPGRAAGA